MSGTDLQKDYNLSNNPTDSIITFDKCFVNLNNGSMGGGPWTCFLEKDNKSHKFASFGGPPDKLLVQQLPKPITTQNYKFQSIETKLCGIHCL